jgi:anti-sigma factor RsiW
MTKSPSDDQMRLLNAAVDGELDAAGVMAVEASLAADPDLAAEYRRLAALRDAIRSRIPRERAPERLRARVLAMSQAPRLQAKAQPRRAWLPLQQYGSLAAALVVGVVIGAGGIARLAPPTADNGDQNAIIAGFIRGRLSGQPVDVATSDRHTVKPWLAGKVAGATTVVDLKSDDFPLVGGRVDVVGTTPVPTLVYQRREHQIALTEMPDSDSPTTPRVTTHEGYALLEWRDGGRRYVAVSDLPPAELSAFGAAFRRAAAAEAEPAPKP